MIEEGTWYLGPLGNLRALDCPEVDLTVQTQRYGGIRQALSGARTMDITGYRSEYTLNFRYLTREDYLWLEALHLRMVPGPFYLIDPLKTNRLTQQSSTLRLTEYNNSGLDITSPYTTSRDWPTELSVPGRSLALSGWQGSSTTIAFDQSKLVPIVGDETLLASVYLKAGAVYAAKLRMSWYDADKVFISNSDYDISLSTSWNRYWFAYHETPTDAAAAKLSIVLGSASTTVSIAAPQVEAGTLFPTPWSVGGAAAQVLIDQLPTTSPVYPLRDAELQLLEA